MEGWPMLGSKLAFSTGSWRALHMNAQQPEPSAQTCSAHAQVFEPVLTWSCSMQIPAMLQRCCCITDTASAYTQWPGDHTLSLGSSYASLINHLPGASSVNFESMGTRRLRLCKQAPLAQHTLLPRLVVLGVCAVLRCNQSEQAHTQLKMEVLLTLEGLWQ